MNEAEHGQIMRARERERKARECAQSWAALVRPGCSAEMRQMAAAAHRDWVAARDALERLGGGSE
jgi:hypothetical protein